MADLERNKQVVVEYYELAFNGKQPEQAVERYVGSQYIQHNPQAPDGPEAFIGFVRAFPEAFPEVSVDIRRVFADGDIVITHSLVKFTPDDRGTVAADFFPGERQDRRALGRVGAVPRGQREPAPDVLGALRPWSSARGSFRREGSRSLAGPCPPSAPRRSGSRPG